MTVLLTLLPVPSSAQKGKKGKDSKEEAAAPAEKKPAPLPKLSRAKEITVGRLANGVEYFLIPNTVSKGYAEFALVQKGAPEVSLSRASLVKAPHFEPRVPYRFLAENGVGYTSDGYVEYRPDATIFRFKDVPVSITAASDSTTLLLFDLVENHPSDQAIIVSGDITVAKFLERMQVFSMLVSKRLTTPVPNPYVWNPSSAARYEYTSNATGNVASVSVKYSTERLPKDQLNTTVPLVLRAYAEQLGIVLKKRIRTEFEENSIPLGGAKFVYSNSADSAGDETYTLTVYTEATRLPDAVGVIAKVLSDLDHKGVTDTELQDVKITFAAESALAAKNAVLSNEYYVERCVSSYLYGTDLASHTFLNDYFSHKDISSEKNVEIFNNVAFALLDENQNLEITFDTPRGFVSKVDLPALFTQKWEAAVDAPTRDYRVDNSDTLSLVLPDSKEKVKIKSEVSDPVTGGKLWTFTNGMKVVFKKTAGNTLNYALLLKGGCTNVAGLAPGESAFVSDMLRISDFAGMSGENFHNMLHANGVTMNEDISISDMRISGNAPASSLELVLKSMLSMANARKINREAFENYKSGEAIRTELSALTDRGIDAVMDSLMCPDYAYPDHKSIENLKDDLPERAEAFFAKQFSKMNDGVLILIGGLNEDVLKKTLCKYLGTFVANGKVSSRPKVEYNLRNGWSTINLDSSISSFGDGGRSVNVAMATQSPISITKYMEFQIAAEALKKALVESLATCGYSVEVTPEVKVIPSERLSLFINCRPADADGLPEGIVPVHPNVALAAVRKAVNKVSNNPIPEADLNVFKTSLTNAIASRLARPEALVDAALTRYSDGKDFVTGYAEQVKAVKGENVAALLKALDSSSKIEYIIR